MRRGEIEGRINAEYYKSEFRQLLHKILNRFPDIKPLGSYGDVVCGPFGSAIKLSDYVDDGVPLLRIANISDEGNVDMQDAAFITPEMSKQQSSTQVSEGDIVVSQRGTLGKTAVVSSEYPVFNISANLIAIQNISGLDSRFVQIYLASTSGKSQLARLRSGQVHAKITTDDMASVLVPDVPNQSELGNAMDSARGERKAKLAEADALLAGIDGFLLDALDVAAPIEDRRRVFAVSLAQTRRQGRLNSEYYRPVRILALRKLGNTADNLTVASLVEVVAFERAQIKTPGENYLGLAHVQSHTGELTKATDTSFGKCFTYQVDDVLFARLRPYLNKVYRAEMNGCCSTEFHVLRVKDRATLLPEYLAAVLRSRLVLAQTIHMMSGNTHPRLTNDDVANLTIPFPAPEVQGIIAAEVCRRREEARRLRAEAEAEWEGAKRRFEEELWGADNATQEEGKGPSTGQTHAGTD